MAHFQLRSEEREERVVEVEVLGVIPAAATTAVRCGRVVTAAAVATGIGVGVGASDRRISRGCGGVAEGTGWQKLPPLLRLLAGAACRQKEGGGEEKEEWGEEQ